MAVWRGDWRIAQAVAIKDGRFLAVGDDSVITAHIGPNTKVIDLASKTVVPGLIDTHLHQLLAAMNGPAVQLLGARNIADVQNAIAARVARTEPAKWVTASCRGPAARATSPARPSRRRH